MRKQECLKARLSLLYFLQFSVWGCYLTCFGQFLGAGGLGREIAWFYAAIGLMSIITPSLMGRLADIMGRPEKLLGFSHFSAAVVMLVMWRYGETHSQLEFKILYPLYLLFLSLYLPTMALANTTAFGLIAKSGYNTVTTFPAIRIWGTVGFVVAMWFVNSACWSDGSLIFVFSDNVDSGHLRFQYNAMQLCCSGVAGLLASAYSFSLPSGLSAKKDACDISSRISMWRGLKMMYSKRELRVFFIFVILTGVCLQISNGFATPFITHFVGLKEYAGSIASGNATMLFSLSQISEAFCILLVGITLKSIGIRYVYALGLLAWSLRFLMLGIGNPGNGLWALIGSMVMYGFAFNFITIAGHLYVQQTAPEDMKGFAQGFMMFMSNGIGATFGTLAAGAVVNKWCGWEMVSVSLTEAPVRLFMGEWIYPWSIFAIYAFVIMLMWILFFRKSSNQTTIRK